MRHPLFSADTVGGWIVKIHDDLVEQRHKMWAHTDESHFEDADFKQGSHGRRDRIEVLKRADLSG